MDEATTANSHRNRRDRRGMRLNIVPKCGTSQLETYRIQVVTYGNGMKRTKNRQKRTQYLQVVDLDLDQKQVEQIFFLQRHEYPAKVCCKLQEEYLTKAIIVFLASFLKNKHTNTTITWPQTNHLQSARIAMFPQIYLCK